MFYTYILYSKSIDKFYIGATENLSDRLKKQINKSKGFTNRADDWELVFSVEFNSKKEALAFEKTIKSWKSKIKIQKLIKSIGLEHPDAQQSGGSGVRAVTQ